MLLRAFLRAEAGALTRKLTVPLLSLIKESFSAVRTLPCRDTLALWLKTLEGETVLLGRNGGSTYQQLIVLWLKLERVTICYAACSALTLAWFSDALFTCFALMKRVS